MRVLCKRLALHTSEPVPKGADPHPAPFFYWLPCAVTPESGGACGADGLPSKAIAFEQPARPHAPASRLKGAAPAQTGALFFSRPKFGRAASSRKKQRERQSRPFPAPTAEIRRAFDSPHTTNQQHLKKALSRETSSEIAEELTATAPLQFGRQSMNETEKTQYIPAPSNILQSEGDCEVS